MPETPRPYALPDALPDALPYALCTHHTAAPALQRLSAVSPVIFDITDPDPLASAAAVTLFRLVNAANALAFGGLGMPAWVQLDCCTLPSLMVGFCAPASTLAPDLREQLRARAGLDALPDHQRVPLSEFCALPSLDPDAVVGVSLFSLLPGLGARTKALGWLALGARRHLGVTQYRNRAVRAHCRLSPLEILTPALPVHDLGPQSFLYQSVIPPADTLRAWASAEGPPALPTQQPTPADLDAVHTLCAADRARLIDLDRSPPTVAAAVAEAKATWGRAWICAPGHVTHHGRPHLLLVRGGV